MFQQISGNETVPSKVPSVSEVSDKKKSSLPYILPQKYMPNPTVILASSTSLLHLMPFWPGIAETELRALTLLKGEERSRVTPGAGKGVPQDRPVVGKQGESGSSFSEGQSHL